VHSCSRHPHRPRECVNPVTAGYAKDAPPHRRAALSCDRVGGSSSGLEPGDRPWQRPLSSGHAIRAVQPNSGAARLRLGMHLSPQPALQELRGLRTRCRTVSRKRTVALADTAKGTVLLGPLLQEITCASS
jgi:hypothetical protein